MDNPTVPGHAFYGNHDNFGEQIPPSSPGLAYFTYFRPHPHASLNPNELMDGPNLNPFDDSYRQNEIFASHAFPSIDVHHPTWRNQPTPSSPTGTQMIETSPPNLRPTVGELDPATGSRFPGHSFSSNQR